jgi:hypothetical protein
VSSSLTGRASSLCPHQPDEQPGCLATSGYFSLAIFSIRRGTSPILMLHLQGRFEHSPIPLAPASPSGESAPRRCDAAPGSFHLISRLTGRIHSDRVFPEASDGVEIACRIVPHYGNASFGSIERRLPTKEWGDRRITSAMPIAPRKGTAPTFPK